MARRDAHPLANLPFASKAGATVVLISGTALFLAAVFVSVLMTNWRFDLAGLLGWGGMLMRIRATHTMWFFALFGAHVAALALIAAVAAVLLARVALPRKGRAALIGLVWTLGGLDVLCWLLLGYGGLPRVLLGPVVIAEGAALLYVVGRPIRDLWMYARWKPSDGPKRVVIVGGGFAGLYAARKLDALLGHHPSLEIVLLDRRNYFLFPPLLPSVATGAIETRQVTYPFRRIFEATNVLFRRETVESIDLERRVVRTQADADTDATGTVAACHRETSYDVLLLAPGSDTQTFGTSGVAEHAFFMRELGDAVAVRNHLIDCFELAAQELDPDRRARLLRFVVVGAGPTGVELVAEVRDLAVHVLLKRYPEIEASELDLVLVQSGPAVLPGWNASVAARTAEQLAALGVRILTGRRVLAVDPFRVTLDGGEILHARTTMWCAGVRPSGLLAAVDLPKHPSGRIPVQGDLRVSGRDDVFVLGDAAVCLHAGKPLPPLGQVAFQQGTLAAVNVVRLLQGKASKPFKYFDYGALVSVGEHFAAVDLLGIRLSGFVAWFVWRTLYLSKLVGFGNKVRVMLDWTLDLLVERSISQVSTSRQDLRLVEDHAADGSPEAPAEARIRRA